MNYYDSNSFNKLYFTMLQDSYSKNIKLTESRAGKVKDLGRTVYQIKSDRFRLCFLKERNINPFFAFAEFSWILKGSNLLKPLEYFISSYKQFSDDDKTLNGAYGFRLNEYFEFNQIEKAILSLKNDRNSRRVVLTMYSPKDLLTLSKDIPCNTTIYLKVKENKLDITILNRSNDLFLGVPYNVFVFYLLQVYIANKIDCDIGVQTHYTDSLHLYERDLSKVNRIIESNSIEEISYIETKYNMCDNSKYIFINHEKILNLEFNELEESSYKNMYMMFDVFKKNNMVDYNKIPKNLLGLCIYNWFNKRKNIEKEALKYFDNDIVVRKPNHKEVLNTLKYETVENILKILGELNIVYLNKIDEFKRVVSDDDKNISIFKLEIIDHEKFLYIILLTLVVESLSSNIYNLELRTILMNKVKKVCSILNINISDIFYFAKYENSIISILD